MILYAKIGTQSFEDFHNLLSTAKNVYYIFRHFDSKSSATDVQDGVANEEAVHLMSLQGYGLELQIKNMEYSALDQKAKTGNQIYHSGNNSRYRKETRRRRGGGVR